MARIPLVSLLSSVYTVNESIYVEVAVTFIFFYKVAQVPWSNASVNGRLHLLRDSEQRHDSNVLRPSHIVK